jgi:electron transfer flavoprotein beta subunit
MNFVVCCKRVPDTTARIKIAGDGRSIDWQGVEAIINPYDEIALECALKLKEKAGSGEVIALTVDPDGNESIVRKALAMGADRAILVKGGVNFDGLAVARILAENLKAVPFDVVFFGKQAIDDDSYSVPSMVAHLLGLPRVNVAVGFEIDGKTAKCRRQIEGGEELVDIPLPCVVSVQKGVNGIHEPRFASLKGIMAAKKKPVDMKTAGPVDACMEVVKLELPPERPPGRIVGKGPEAVKELVRILREEAKVL